MLMSNFITHHSLLHNIRNQHPFRLLVRNASKKKRIEPSSPYIPTYCPKGPNQTKYVEYLNNPRASIVLGVGPAGTGKTMFACATAVKELQEGKINKIVVTRPIVPVEEDIGYLPGSLINKMNPWTRPIFDILEESYNSQEINSMINSGIIEISPLAFMRGRTFKKSFIIADEMQNCSPNQMFMLVTRIGEGSRMVITGDLKQSDRCDNNGLLDILNKLKTKQFHDIKTTFFNDSDVERSAIVSKIINLYSEKQQINIPIPTVEHSSYSVFSKLHKPHDT